MKCFFFDRDGVLIKNYGYFCDKDKIKWLDQYLYRRGKTLDGLDKRYIEWIEDLRKHHEE